MRLALVTLLLGSQAIAAPAVFLRAGGGVERSRETALRDRDCTATQPPALFGCGFEAAGDFGRGPSFEVAAGIGSQLRLELALGYRELDLMATSNFTGVTGDQPVRAEGRSVNATINGVVQFAPRSWRVRPFVVAGVGVARNTTGKVTYAFPAIGNEAVTITRGGSDTGLTWNAGLGASLELTGALSLDLSFRHTDLGTIRSPRGTATIIRPTRTFELEVGETRADVSSRGVVVSLRWRV